MSRMSDLLRNTRLAQLSRSGGGQLSFTKRGQHFPTHQIVATTPASHAREEWGLKGTVPKRLLRSRYLVVDALDTAERMPSLEMLGGVQWNRIRFQEFGVVPSVPLGQSNPLFGDSTTTAAPGNMQLYGLSQVVPNASMLRRLRPQFKAWLLERDPHALQRRRFNALELKEKAVEFLQEQLSTVGTRGRSRPVDRGLVGSGGLSYGVRGRLQNTPRGVVQRSIVPGRILNDQLRPQHTSGGASGGSGGDTMCHAALGGFFASAQFKNGSKISYGLGSFIRELVLPFEVRSVSVARDGKVRITASSITQLRGHRAAAGHASARGEPRNSRSSSTTKATRQQSRETVNELLLQLENNGKN
ncbi:mitochondrial 37S ribosomal protein bS1m KNAG_0H01530 [Huiozyma naganishii CBS 8797]|uniref:Uncharacterized protein n=1 Tax=Huiozyma naganishii (strain ATCC MYA-139 / BCRC 22969 / CBS 8797 / KCTC 17520 / NBRC 10181 / NCYC 3082 / Yp74L-3) TaxID=1071383 RepID=J7S1Q2_HUIN7|nr:hypothetical protein KNAG_0H01530 [Kazachstania naganishii CBS 8797]CCK71567.1 hypothetical protein KNAG_0H01530 [Kazachstania naganishii CBS 8797]